MTDVPFLKGRTVLLVDDPAGSLGSYYEKNREMLRIQFKAMRRTLVFIPDLLASLTPELLGYQFPGLTKKVTSESIYSQIREAAGLGSEAGFLYESDGEVRFSAILEVSEKAISEVLGPMNVLHYTNECSDTIESSRRASRRIRYEKIVFPEAEDVEESINFSLVRKDERRYCDEDWVPHRQPLPSEAPLDAQTRAIIEAWRKFEEEFGITIDDLDRILGYSVRLSRLSISRIGEICLTDYENAPVKLDDLTKALYFFFLKHPEGARLKDLQDYETEILRIYESITGRDDLEGIKKSVSKLLAPYGNDMNVSLSRIKKAFRDIVGDRIAEHYYVVGAAGEIKRITLDRDLVIWED
ncbi:MAG: hypothetical protein J5699_03015 [Bacteroidales bacterium]|nr:hypothetical protein [Bacteroidales bacterium]